MSSFFENLLKPFSTREKTVTNEKKKQKKSRAFTRDSILHIFNLL